MAKKKTGSPLASGGAGTLFEYRVAAIMLVHLLRNSHPPSLQVPMVRLGLQQSARGHLLDDIVVYGEPGSVCTEFQVKRTLTVTATDADFVDVVTQALHVLRERDRDVERGELALGLIAEGNAAPVDQLSKLTEWARGHSSHETFAEVVRPRVVDEKYRTRLTRVRDAVAAAIAAGAPDLGGTERTTHQLLAALHVWRPMVEDDGEQYRAALDQLRPVADSFSVTPASLFAHLEALAKDWGPRAGVVDAASVWRQLRRRGLSGSGSSPALLDGEEIDVDAVVRGPIEALNLRREVDAAEAWLAAGEPAAVDAFAAIAERLKEARFMPDAGVMLRRRADALQAIGQVNEAVAARVGLAWDELDRARVWEAGFALHDGRQPGPSLTLAGPIQRTQSAAEAAVQVAKGGSLGGLAVAFDCLQNEDQYVARAAVFLCEEAIADDQPQIVFDRLDALRAIAAAAADDTADAGRERAIRIQMCIADATGDWIGLMRDALRRQPRPTVAWLHARRARHLALSGDGPGAQEHYLEAIERACVERMFDEAADWLYALRTVRFWYEPLGRDEQHPRAQAVRPHAKPSGLPGSPHSSELALRAMLDESRPVEALQLARRWRWQAFVRAQLTDELDAVQTVGTLLQQRGDIEESIKSFARAGSREKAVAAARELPDRPAHVASSTLTPAPTSRAAAFAAAAAASDLMDDDEARAWAERAFEELRNPHTRISLTGGSPYLRAFDVLAAVCDVLTPGQEDALIQLVEPTIDRAADHYRHTDEPVAEILSSLASRRSDVLALLCRAIVTDERMASIILRRGDLLREHREQIAELLTPHATDNVNACQAIIRAGADPAATRELARSSVNQMLTAREHRPYSLTGYAGATEVAVLASVLDQDTRNRFAWTMLERATDQRELKFSRWNDLAGLVNISDKIAPETQARLLPRVMEIARGEHEAGPGLDDDLQLAPLALSCAAGLSPDPAQCAEIEQIGTALLQAGEGSEQWRIVGAMSYLPTEYSKLDLWLCSVHPLPALRTLAAIRWARNPSVLSLDRAAHLARDSDYRVRRELARALRGSGAGSTTEGRLIVETLTNDVRRCVRKLALPTTR
ncbi:hypothetical protein AB0B27_22115 [Micromonospora rifamycinica]|uniref:hypothetical protein n=1 Tax=Micromonospora rifamycinica TaxID=291594 RepID=UPI0033C99A14